MRPARTVRAKVIALVVGVAAASTFLTGWLSSRSAERAIRENATRSLEDDAAIYQALIDYAVTHPDWSEVDATLAALAARYDRRVALADVRGPLLYDSDRADGGESRGLPSRPVARVDPLTPALSQFPTISALEVTAISPLVVDQATTCLRSNGITFEMVDSGEQQLPQPVGALDPGTLDTFTACTNAIYAVPASAPPIEGSVIDNTGCLVSGSSAVAGAEDAVTGVAGPATGPTGVECSVPAFAPAMLLYLGTKTDVSPFAGPSIWRTLGLAATILAVAGTAAWLLARRLTRPLSELTVAAGRLEAGDFTHRVTQSSHDEVGVLSRAFNSLASSLHANELQRRRMVSDIAHELRNPLVTISGTLEAIEDGVYEPNKVVIGSLREETDHLTGLVRDLQELTTADSGSLRVELEPFDLGELVSSAVDAHQSVAAKAGIELTAIASVSALVMIDPARMRQVLGNLLSNAIRHSAPGDAVTAAVSADGFSVTDTGEGIAQDDLPYVFERFWRADPSRTRTTGGSGLGLAIVKELVDVHGARITVESELGRGSTFAVAGLRSPSPSVAA